MDLVKKALSPRDWRSLFLQIKNDSEILDLFFKTETENQV